MTEMNKTPNSDDRQKALKEVFLREIREELESDRSRKPSFEEFQKAVATDKKARRKRHTAIAACFIVALLAGFFAFDMLAYDVDANKNPKEVIETEDGVIIEDGGYGSSEEEDNVWVVTNWGDVDEAKKALPQLIVPQYLPKNFEFDKMIVESAAEIDLFCEYTFSNEAKDSIEIELVYQSGEVSTELSGNLRELATNYGKAYIIESEDKKANILLNDGIRVCIVGAIPDNEIIKIINALEY